MNIDLNLEYFIEIEKINYYLKSNYELAEYLLVEDSIIGKVKVDVDFFNIYEEFESKTYFFEFKIDVEKGTKLINLKLENLLVSVFDNQGIQIYYLINLEIEKDESVKNDVIDLNNSTDETVLENESNILDEIKKNIVLDVNNTLDEVLRPKNVVYSNHKRESYMDILKDQNKKTIVKYINEEKDIEKISNEFKVPLDDMYRNFYEKKVKVVIINDRKD